MNTTECNDHLLTQYKGTTSVLLLFALSSNNWTTPSCIYYPILMYIDMLSMLPSLWRSLWLLNLLQCASLDWLKPWSRWLIQLTEVTEQAVMCTSEHHLKETFHYQTQCVAEVITNPNELIINYYCSRSTTCSYFITAGQFIDILWLYCTSLCDTSYKFFTLKTQKV